MGMSTFYDVLGVSEQATIEEITLAKNRLAKIYHPDANMQDGIDTTMKMQEVLEAFETLADEEKRKKYDEKVLGTFNRVFKTFTFEKEKEEQRIASFVSYWSAVNHLHEAVKDSVTLVERHMRSKTKRLSYIQRLFIGKTKNQEVIEELQRLSLLAAKYITVLSSAGISAEYWNHEAMNWVLVQWGQNQKQDYLILLNRYDVLKKESMTSSERMHLNSQNRRFRRRLKTLVEFAA